MKAKIISTGEIVKIVSSKFEMGYVTVLREDKKFTNVASDEIEMIEMIDDWGEKEIDWEQRRYEIAKDALAGIISEESIPGVDPFHYIDKDVSRAIEYADELIKRLKTK